MSSNFIIITSPATSPFVNTIIVGMDLEPRDFYTMTREIMVSVGLFKPYTFIPKMMAIYIDRCSFWKTKYFEGVMSHRMRSLLLTNPFTSSLSLIHTHSLPLVDCSSHVWPSYEGDQCLRRGIRILQSKLHFTQLWNVRKQCLYAYRGTSWETYLILQVLYILSVWYCVGIRVNSLFLKHKVGND